MKTLLLALTMCMTAAAGHAAMQTPPDADHVLTRAEASDRADARFAQLDTDRDGTLTAEERRAGRPGPGPGAAPAPGAPDARTVTAADYRDRALRRFDRADTNHDGRLDPAERQAERAARRDRRMGGDDAAPPVAPDR